MLNAPIGGGHASYVLWTNGRATRTRRTKDAADRCKSTGPSAPLALRLQMCAKRLRRLPAGMVLSDELAVLGVARAIHREFGIRFLRIYRAPEQPREHIVPRPDVVDPLAEHGEVLA